MIFIDNDLPDACAEVENVSTRFYMVDQEMHIRFHVFNSWDVSTNTPIGHTRFCCISGIGLHARPRRTGLALLWEATPISGFALPILCLLRFLQLYAICSSRMRGCPLRGRLPCRKPSVPPEHALRATSFPCDLSWHNAHQYLLAALPLLAVNI